MMLLHVQKLINTPTKHSVNQGGGHHRKFKYIPSPYGYSKYGLIGVWAVAWPLVNHKHKDGKGARRGDLE